MDEKINKKIQEIVSEFQSDPRNKVFVDFETLALSAMRETGKDNLEKKLIAAIGSFIDGSLENHDLPVYDGALSVCYEVADLCFKPKNKDESSYDFTWLEENNGYSVEIRPA